MPTGNFASLTVREEPTKEVLDKVKEGGDCTSYDQLIRSLILAAGAPEEHREALQMDDLTIEGEVVVSDE